VKINLASTVDKICPQCIRGLGIKQGRKEEGGKERKKERKLISNTGMFSVQ